LRGKIGEFFPVFLLALMLQVLAPVGAALSMTAAANDPLSGTPICAQPSDGAPGQAPDDQHNHCTECCVLCGFAHLGMVPVEPTFASGLQLAWVLAQYPARSPAAPSPRRIGLSGRPRAPPAFS
jgi:Protein of unknown function (DUF2946)